MSASSRQRASGVPGRGDAPPGEWSWGYALLSLGLVLASCKAYDEKLIREPDPSSRPNPMDAGREAGDGHDGGDDDGGIVCPGVPEQCNGIDDDCDGRTDEDTVQVCAQTIVNAKNLECVPFGSSARCVLIECLDGYVSCDGDPSNGCEPYCMCNECNDAGLDDAGL